MGPSPAHDGVGVGSLCAPRSPLGNLRDRAVLCAAWVYGIIRGETFGTEKMKGLVGELEEVGVLAFLKTARGMAQRSTGGAPFVKRWRANS
jgi:hypothetical protein